MTKETIFPLYVGKCKVKVGNEIYDYVGIKDNIIYVFDEVENDYFTFNISDCVLLLKPISEMSEGHRAIYEDLLTTVSIEAGRGIYRNTNHEVLQLAINNVQDFLTLNGYEISDELFTLGIARRV